MADFLKRISSRKFLLALAAEVAAMVILVKPGLADTANVWAVQIATLATMLLIALGYIKTEGDIDKVRAAKGK